MGITDDRNDPGLARGIDDEPVPMNDRSDPEPQPSDGPDYHAEHAAWKRRQDTSNGSLREVQK